MKYIVTLCFSIFILVISSYADENVKNKTKITYGYPDQSIFIATINGKEQPITPMLNVVKELFGQTNLSWDSEAYPAKRLIRNLKSGKTDFSILVKASSLLNNCIFSKKPIYSTNLNVYYIGDKPPITTKEDFIGKRVVMIRGYSYGSLRKFLNNPKNNITIESTSTHSSAFSMLKYGRADYLLDYASAAKDIISQDPIADLKSYTLDKVNIFLVLSKSYPNADKLMNKLETIMESIDINKIMDHKSENTITH
ncbi:substrate-binding periplasmic protein [Sulfurospirillum arcachonense]|uniref:substrate-binding periplasmic protein n=1 Tax=Sulfurospirillum arcachonense TaxID=57666 RepID=UPI00046A63FB|nr:transporter substrate-binding domain-containing protein [Sulfurospirillum arcachonense]